MITVWNSENKRVTPLLQAPISASEEGHYRIPILKLEGNESILIDMVDKLVETIDKHGLYVYTGSPSESFDRTMQCFTTDISSAVGIAYKSEVEEGVLFVTIRPTDKDNLKRMMDCQVWLDVSVPYLAVVSNKQHYVTTWANRIYIDTSVSLRNAF